MNKVSNIDDGHVSVLYERIARLIEQARQRVATTVKLAEVYAKYHIGQYIVEEEQGGKEKATYGKQVLKVLSGKLTNRFGCGWSVDTLEKCRMFYQVYSNSATMLRNLGDYIENVPDNTAKISKSATPLRILNEHSEFTLS